MVDKKHKNHSFQGTGKLIRYFTKSNEKKMSPYRSDGSIRASVAMRAFINLRTF